MTGMLWNRSSTGTPSRLRVVSRWTRALNWKALHPWASRTGRAWEWGLEVDNIGWCWVNFWFTIWLFNIWKIHYKWRFIAGKIIRFYGPFSIAMLNNQRVRFWKIDVMFFLSDWYCVEQPSRFICQPLMMFFECQSQIMKKIYLLTIQHIYGKPPCFFLLNHLQRSLLP